MGVTYDPGQFHFHYMIQKINDFFFVKIDFLFDHRIGSPGSIISERSLYRTSATEIQKTMFKSIHIAIFPMRSAVQYLHDDFVS